MKNILFVLFILFFLSSCINKDFTKINFRTSTMKVVSGSLMWHNYRGKDSCLIFVSMYSIGYGGIKQIKYAKDWKQIDAECYINGKKYNLDEKDRVELKVPAGKLTISANDTRGFRHPLKQRKIFLPKKRTYGILIYLMEGNGGKEKPN